MTATAKCDPRCGAHEHTGPSGYLAWHDWAEEKSRTYKQIKCPGCGRWTIWVRKRKATTGEPT